LTQVSSATMLASLAVAGQPLSLPERITVKRAIELAGLSFGAGRGDLPDRPRAIIHLDAFFAAVEVLENTNLTGKPVLIRYTVTNSIRRFQNEKA